MKSKRECPFCGCKTIQDRTWLDVNGTKQAIWKCQCCGGETKRVHRALAPKHDAELDALFEKLCGEADRFLAEHKRWED